MSENDPNKSIAALKDELKQTRARAGKAESLLNQAKSELIALSSQGGKERYRNLAQQLSAMKNENTELSAALQRLSKQLDAVQREATHWRGRYLLSELDVVSTTDRADKAEQQLSEAVKPLPYDEQQIVKERELSWLAFTDSLTGLGNSNKLDVELKATLARTLAQGKLTALLMLDIDRFGHLNDFAGWEQGNQLLSAVGERLSSSVPQGTVLVRRAEDEFAILVEMDGPGQGQMGESPLVRCRQISDFLLSRLREPFEVNFQKYPLSVSIGISICPDDADTESELLENAYSALVKAKSKGGNQYQIYSERLYQEKEERANLAAELKSSLLENGLLYLYRPIADAQKGNLAGALVEPYWEHPAHGRVAQSSFMPLAEEHGLMPALVKQLLEAACELSRKMKGSIAVLIRCPSSVLTISGFSKLVMDTINSSRVNPKSLILEFPGELHSTHSGEIQALFSELQRWGVRCSAYYSNGTPLDLNALSHGVVNQLSLSEELMDAVPAQEARRSVVQAFLDSASRLALPTFVNGVSDSSQGHFLALHQAAWLSGDFISPPLDLAGFLARRRTSWTFR